MPGLSRCRWLLACALAWGAAHADTGEAWRRPLHQSHADAGRAVAQAQASAVTDADRDQAWRQALQWQDLYGRHAELAAVLREIEARPGLADERLLYQARVDIAAGRHAEAARALEPLRRKFVRLPDSELRRELRLTLAELDLHLGQPEEATRELNRMVDAARQAGEMELAARAFNRLGAVQLEMFDYAAGLGYHEQALRLAPDWAVQTRERARMGVAQMHNMLGNRTEAFALLDQALEGFHRTGNLRAEADGLLLRGFFLHRAGQAVAALEPYRQALALREQLGGDADIVNALTHLCATLGDVKRVTEALALCERATRMAEATDSQSLRWDAYWISAETHAAAGDFRMAYDHQLRSTEALKKHARLTLISLTGAMRERFDVERQRLDNERLTAQLSGEQDGRAQLRGLAWTLGSLAAVLAAALVWLWRRRSGERGPAQASLNSASAT